MFGCAKQNDFTQFGQTEGLSGLILHMPGILVSQLPNSKSQDCRSIYVQWMRFSLSLWSRPQYKLFHAGGTTSWQRRNAITWSNWYGVLAWSKVKCPSTFHAAAQGFLIRYCYTEAAFKVVSCSIRQVLSMGAINKEYLCNKQEENRLEKEVDTIVIVMIR